VKCPERADKADLGGAEMSQIVSCCSVNAEREAGG
jgi:hypothetical protein